MPTLTVRVWCTPGTTVTVPAAPAVPFTASVTPRVQSKVPGFG